MLLNLRVLTEPFRRPAEIGQGRGFRFGHGRSEIAGRFVIGHNRRWLVRDLAHLEGFESKAAAVRGHRNEGLAIFGIGEGSVHLDVPAPRSFGLRSVDEGLIVDTDLMVDRALDWRSAPTVAMDHDLLNHERRDVVSAAVPADDGVVLQSSQ